ncbi:MAG: hypothetical protein K6U14_08270 [Firmicutes bacterium]|nr:hypothetical protein [Alicyclobacillaceae bacterium]MCL6497606.1 hypothetical protein [Bacillota bacterium]
MRRPLTAFLLLLFLAAQWIFGPLKPGENPAPSPTGWVKLAPEPTALVHSGGQWALVGQARYYRLIPAQATRTPSAASLRWEAIPEPSGAGVWHLLATAEDIPLLGTGGLVYPNPFQPGVALRDPATGQIFFGHPGGAVVPATSTLRSPTGRVVWLPPGNAVAVVGTGPAGYGIWRLTAAEPARLLAPLAPGTHVLALGWDASGALLWATDTGRVFWQGHGALPLPPLTSVAIARGAAAVFGIDGHGRVVFWQPGHVQTRALPALSFTGRPRFAPSGAGVAVVAETPKHQLVVLWDTPRQMHEVPLPDTPPVDYHLAGIWGPWVVVEALDGPHPGTYAYPIAGPHP